MQQRRTGDKRRYEDDADRRVIVGGIVSDDVRQAAAGIARQSLSRIGDDGTGSNASMAAASASLTTVALGRDKREGNIGHQCVLCVLC